MPQREDDKPEITDPIVLAAMIEDPDEDEDTKKLREEILGTDETAGTATGKPADDEDEDEDDPKKGKSGASDDDEDDDDNPDDKDDPAKPKAKKPVEAEDDPDDEDLEDEDEPKKTRKQKRQERQEDFLTSIRKDGARDPRRARIPDYKPLDYEAEDEEGNPRAFKPEELQQDRQMVEAVGFAKGVDEARYWNEQDNFWRDLTMESKIVSYDPKLAFLSEETPDGEKNPDFDPDKAEEINARYLQMVGFKQFYKTDNNGNVLYDPRTRQPMVVSTVDRTDISYEKFARAEVKRLEKWANERADEREDETRENITKQRKNQGIRPGGGSRKTLGALQPGDISRMSEAELEKNEDAIMAQIDNMLGI